MLVEASLIGGWFMHLRFERVALVVSVAGGILASPRTGQSSIADPMSL